MGGWCSSTPAWYAGEQGRVGGVSLPYPTLPYNLPTPPGARGVGDLVLVYKRVTALAGHTSRVAELLEQVQRLAAGNPDETTRSLCARTPPGPCGSSLAWPNRACRARRVPVLRSGMEQLIFYTI